MDKQRCLEYLDLIRAQIEQCGEINLPIFIEEQGSFFAGGQVFTTPGVYDPDQPFEKQGQTLHGDHAYVFYQIPVNSKRYPLIFLHGAGQSGKSFETTPDGRDGFQNIFLRKGYKVFLIDQPRRGRAGQGLKATEIKAESYEQLYFEAFRIGQWPDFYPEVEFSRQPEALNQFFRQVTPDTGAFDINVVSEAVSAVFERSGEGILVAHSQGCIPGLFTAIKNKKVKSLVLFEPGAGMIFPPDEVPEPKINNGYYGPLHGERISKEKFLRLTKIPIIIFYGDYIPNESTAVKGQDNWRARMLMAKDFVDTVNRHGGDAKLVKLPDEGIFGNTHFPFSDLNNQLIADMLEDFLLERNLV